MRSKSTNSLNLLEKMIEYGYNPLITPTALGLGLVCKKIKKDYKSLQLLKKINLSTLSPVIKFIEEERLFFL